MRTMIIRHTFSSTGANPAVYNQEQTWAYVGDDARLRKIADEHYEFLRSGMMTKIEITFANTAPSINNN